MDPDTPDLIPVLVTGDQGLVLLARSILDDAEIPYVVQGEGVQDLFSLGRLGTGFNPLTGPIVILVHPEDEEDARGLLAEIPGPSGP